MSVAAYDPNDPRTYWQENLLINEVAPSVGVRPESEVPRTDGRLVLARGGFTGSRHTIAGPGATLFGPVGDSVSPPILVVHEAVRVCHELPDEGEVASEMILPGWYVVILFETDASYAGPPFLRPKRSGSTHYIERPDLLRLVRVEPGDRAHATAIGEPSHRIDVLSVAGERAWLEGPQIRAQEDARRDRFFHAEAGGFLVHERNGKSTRVRLPREAFRIVWT